MDFHILMHFHCASQHEYFNYKKKKTYLRPLSPTLGDHCLGQMLISDIMAEIFKIFGLNSVFNFFFVVSEAIQVLIDFYLGGPLNPSFGGC